MMKKQNSIFFYLRKKPYYELDSKEEIQKSIKENQRVIIYFSSQVIEQEKRLSSVFTELAIDYQFITCIKINYEMNPEIFIQYNVKSIPTFFFYYEGKLMKQLVKVNKQSIQYAFSHF